MIHHCVALKALPGRIGELNAALDQFVSELSPLLSGLVELTWGENLQPRSLEMGYTHCMLASFADRHAVEAYQKHPVHQELGPTLNQICESRIAFDYEVRPA